jgi:catechol 2,3-dioxygenase-like lactoylglutathione lyase family enzyme
MTLGPGGGQHLIQPAEQETMPVPGPLSEAHAVTKLPAQDLDRARRFYADKLGLEPVEERDGGLRFICAGTEFHLFSSSGAPSGASTQMGFEVTDLRAVIEDLRRRGVTFEAVEVPGFETQGEMVVVPDNYPSKGSGELGAFFYDSEGNLLALGQATNGGDAGDGRPTSTSASPESSATSDVTHVGIDELEAIDGFLEGFTFRRAAAQMGVTPFGMSIIDMPAKTTAYPEHDHSSEGPGNPPAHQLGQEEVYIALRGSADVQIGGHRYKLDSDHIIRVGPTAPRKILPGPDGVRLLAIGGFPGRAYDPASTV